MRPSLISWVTLSVISLAQAQTTFTVDPGQGTDSPACGPAQTPCATISQADTNAATLAQDFSAVIVLRPGHYELSGDNEVIPNSRGYFRLEGDPDVPGNVVIDGLGTSVGLVEWEASTTPYEIEGITFTGSTGAALFLVSDLVIHNCVFDFSPGFSGGISTGSAGRAIALEGPEDTPELGPSLTASNIVTRGHVTDSGVLHCFACASFTLTDSQFLDTVHKDDTGVLSLEIVDTVVVDNVLIDGVTSCGEGAVELEETSSAIFTDFTIRNVIFSDDDCEPDEAGAISAESAAYLEFTRLIVANAVGSVASALLVEDCGTVVIRDSQFLDNTARQFATVLLTNIADEEMTVDINNTVFRGNTARLSSGAIEFATNGEEGTTVRAHNLTLIDNAVTDLAEGRGGALTVSGSRWRIRFSGASTIGGNTAEFGGALFTADVDETEVEFDGVTFVGNTANRAGGAVYSNGCSLTFNECTFTESAATSGGTEFTRETAGGASIEFNDCKIEDSVAEESGGAISMGNGELILRSTPITNTSGGLGGAVFVGAFAVLTLEDIEIENCHAGGFGACIGILGYGGALYFDDDSCASAHVSNVAFMNNSAEVAGGVFFSSSAECDEDEWCSGCTFDDTNTATFGELRAAPFSEFRASHDGSLSVELGTQFIITALPFDAYGQQMTGDHELVFANIRSPADRSPEVLMCGDRTTTAIGGNAVFAFTMYLTDASGTGNGSGANAINDVVNSRENAPLDLEFLTAEGDVNLVNPQFLPLSIGGCAEDFELDVVPSAEALAILDACVDMDYNTAGGAEPPTLLTCLRVSDLRPSQRAFVVAVAGICLLFGSIPFIVSIYYRTNRVMWTSSMCMMSVSAVGYFAIETGAILRSFRPVNSAMCMSYMWLLVIGLNLMIGAIFAKNMRIWKIFTLNTLKVVYISNPKLLAGILVACIPDIVTLLVQTALYPLTVDRSLRSSECSAPHANAFLILYAVWKILWLLVGAWTSYAVRNLPRKFNESKTVGLIVVFVSVCLLAQWAVGTSLVSQGRTIIEVLSTSVAGAVLMQCIFAPKLYLIYRGQDGVLLSIRTPTEESIYTKDRVTKTKSPREENSFYNGGDASDPEPSFKFKERFEHLREKLKRTQRNYECTYESAMKLRAKFRFVESDLIALQFERDWRARIGGEDLPELSSGDEHTRSFGMPSTTKSRIAVPSVNVDLEFQVANAQKRQIDGGGAGANGKHSQPPGTRTSTSQQSNVQLPGAVVACTNNDAPTNI